MISVKGYRVLDIPICDGQAFHSMYLKEHSENKALKGNSRTLFVGNVDYKLNLSSQDIHDIMKDLFSVFGEIVSISLSDFSKNTLSSSSSNQRNARFAHVEFSTRSSLKSIFSPLSETIISSMKKQFVSKWGLQNIHGNKSTLNLIKKFRYAYVDPEELREAASTYLKEFDENEQIASRRRAAEGDVDEDGFTKVSHRKRSKGDKSATGGKNRTSVGKHRKRSVKKSLELTNFYRFQMREDKQNKLDSLRKRFEQDKVRVEQLKALRKFKPF